MSKLIPMTIIDYMFRVSIIKKMTFKDSWSARTWNLSSLLGNIWSCHLEFYAISVKEKPYYRGQGSLS